MTESVGNAAEVQRGAMILSALLREALRVGHSGSRTFVSTVVATQVLRDAFEFIDDHADGFTLAAAEPYEVKDNVITIPTTHPRAG
jgi:hypothetical protein